jgi:hypothetical protein
MVLDTCISFIKISQYNKMMCLYWHMKEMVACNMDNKKEQDNPHLEHIIDILPLVDDEYDSFLEEICNLHDGTTCLAYRHACGYSTTKEKLVFLTRSTPQHPISFDDKNT